MFDPTKAKFVLDFSQLAMDQLIEIIRANGKSKLFPSLIDFEQKLRNNEINSEKLYGIPVSYMLEAINNMTYFDFFPDDAEKLDYSTEVERKLLEILKDNNFHSKMTMLEEFNQQFEEDVSLTFNEVVKRLSASGEILKFDKNKNQMEASGRGTGKYSFLKIGKIKEE